ncbi:MAG TPA: adenylosuccinate lyase [Steroidobacteraceae bacterium]|jgi:adenylosuccinate lyase|nr:adenylosuccinate lyase [Steroidobacteraceae bacterium]
MPDTRPDPLRPDALPAVAALSPVDGRYRAATEPLRDLLSEAGLIRERVRIEAAWLLHLARAVPSLAGAALAPAVSARASELVREPDADCAHSVKIIEAQINHDVKAVEYYVRQQLAAAGAGAASLELVHFGCTSEDINNLSYARLLGEARRRLLGALGERTAELTALAHREADVPMLARTHGQPASPTTLGKEVANFVARLRRAQRRWSSVEILGKWNGAVGNFNAHQAALPDVDWPAVSRGFIESLGLTCNPYTTQIEPHDWIAEYCDAVAAINIVILDLCRDFWGYISLGYLKQRAAAAEVGSSTMPHKVNPIDFENAEGNLGIANALLRHFADKLPISRWQRDLTDSTVLRNLGVALAHTLIAWRALGRGLGKIDASAASLAADLQDAWEVLGEAVQTVLRAAGVPGGYERLKEHTRGRAIDERALAELIDSLPLPADEKRRLKALRPLDYTGIAARLAREI